MTIIPTANDWRQAAKNEIDLMSRNIGAFTRSNPVERLMLMSRDIAGYVRNGTVTPDGSEQIVGHKMVAMGTLAASHLDSIGMWDKNEMLELLCRKQHDYGHGNILSFGLIGVAVRMADKVARLANLTKKDIDAVNESLLDTWRDIVGYGAIAGMLLVGTFELEL
jgi:hypothetical protein